ncbi:MAG: flagellar export chaperone FliS [Nocardioidaceae bacterium]|nr:flagellar export chaperone FliS [Nocardioidaceae bacterium]MCL2613283.1 flagellar export chaperone FliS [Nocardioidaceae bacterium]
MNTAQFAARSAYQGNSVATATPGQLLVMLFERLVLDCERGLRALIAEDHQAAHTHLVHAQAIVTELQSSLEVDGMPAGRELLSLYGYLQRRLVHANVAHDPSAGKEALLLSRQLCDTWRTAARLAASTEGADR